MRLVAVLVVLLAHHAAAQACKHAGKVLYRETQAPLDGHEDHVPDASFVIYATGAWGWVQEMPEGQEPANRGGCLSKAHVKALVRAIGKAKFASGAPETCDAIPDHEIVYAAPKRKKQVRVTSPCGESVDARTEAMIACARLALDGGRPSAKELRATCRGTP